MALKPSINEAIIEGILYEKIVRNFDDGAIAGELVIEVPVKIDGEEFFSHIPVSFYVKEKTKEGKSNSAYKGVKTIVDSAKALSETDGEPSKADRIRLRTGQLSENMFISQDDRLVSFTRIRGNFFDRVKETDCQPKAQFKVKMIVKSIDPEVEKENGEEFETGRIIVTGNVVQYNGEIDELKFVVQNKKHIDTVLKGWSVDDTVTASGIIKFVTEEITKNGDDEDTFGEALPSTVTRKVREFVITGGSPGPVEGYDEEDVTEARRARKLKIAALGKEKAEKEPAKPAKGKGKPDW